MSSQHLGVKVLDEILEFIKLVVHASTDWYTGCLTLLINRTLQIKNKRDASDIYDLRNQTTFLNLGILKWNSSLITLFIVIQFFCLLMLKIIYKSSKFLLNGFQTLTNWTFGMIKYYWSYRKKDKLWIQFKNLFIIKYENAHLWTV